MLSAKSNLNMVMILFQMCFAEQKYRTFDQKLIYNIFINIQPDDQKSTLAQVPDGTKPLLQTMVTYIYENIQHHYVRISQFTKSGME